MEELHNNNQVLFSQILILCIYSTIVLSWGGGELSVFVQYWFSRGMEIDRVVATYSIILYYTKNLRFRYDTTTSLLGHKPLT